MLATKPLVLATLVVVAAAMPAASPSAAAYDAKVVSPSLCQPYAPDTTAGELQVTQNGIYNPGTTIEKVICAMPRDAEAKYTGEGVEVIVYYRSLGAAPARLVCTLFVGSSSMHSDPIVSSSIAGPLANAGARQFLAINVATQPDAYIMVPNNLICAISPKVSMGAIFIQETGLSDNPGPAA